MAEDARYMGVTIENIDFNIPRLGTWLRRVFYVLGGYIASTGVRAGNVAAVAMIAVAGITSVG
ncbi:hypothetical protein [Mycolicibacterium hodleri]|uniref:Uncharacterized protein n=1 Tax=Mycolicibacterium hodleri TaxID=49897 RepID=A0A502ECP3_9MYCO|nr:hypothetical protein [Mycolicibacterium hodleri]TPG34151.1 hypothetical protein EAH80_11090 [Mycolicibacterium hodleri]